MRNTNKVLGGIVLVLGAIVGSGMLALPLVIAQSGFLLGLALLIVSWGLSTISGFLLIDFNFSLPVETSSFSSMAYKSFGVKGKFFVSIGYLVLLYVMLVVAIIGESDILLKILKSYRINFFSYQHITAIFTFLFGSIVFFSTSAVDYISRIFVFFKGIFLFGALIVVLPLLSPKSLMIPNLCDFSAFKCLYLAIPSFISAFCFQFIIPSLRLYVGEDKKLLKKIVLFSTTVALFIYIWWLVTCLGLEIPNFNGTCHKLTVGSLIAKMVDISENSLFATTLNCFSNITLVTAFLGAGLSLFDFLAAGLKQDNSYRGRLNTALLAFIPPWVITLFFSSDDFIKVVNSASIFTALLCFMLPLLMIRKLVVDRGGDLKNINTSKRTLNFLIFLNIIVLVVNLWCILGE